MKNILIIALFMLTATVTFGQNKWQQKLINHFVEASAQIYNLNPDKKEQLLNARTALIVGYSKVNALNADEKKEKVKQLNKDFHSKMINITGKPYKELQPFLTKMREELKNLK